MNKFSVNSAFCGYADDPVRFVTEKQLKNKTYWDKFCEVFTTRPDSDDNGWKGEFWGKMMRGACLIYQYSHDEELYQVLEYAVEKLLACQDDLGRISTYVVEKEFNGWDMWSRKYVLTGFFHFFDICKSEDLKKRILTATSRHLDYIISKIGEGDGKKQIVDTSHIWGGINSCSILEPVVNAYNLTGNEKFLEFARYIVKTGGCKNGNMVELAFENKLRPVEFPVQKAYETLSFFEGVLALSLVEGDEKLKQAVVNFVDKVIEHEITVIGCAGTNGECFSDSVKKQTENIIPYIMQETCVTVTWMRVNKKLFDVTGDKKYLDNINLSGANSLFGSLNTHLNDQFCQEEERLREGMVFDSYAPLSDDSRGRGIGGFRRFADGSHFGCCIAIGAAGVALVPLCAALPFRDGVLFDQYFNGTVSVTENDEKLDFVFDGNYPVTPTVVATVKTQTPFACKIYFAQPTWSKSFGVSVNGEKFASDGQFVTVEKTWQNGDKIVVTTEQHLESQKLNGKTCYKFGAFVLATNYQKSCPEVTEKFSTDNGVEFVRLAPEKEENLRFVVKHGGKNVLLTDFASTGKENYSDIMTVWLKD